eukprot:TRINITY_DN6222_c1_g4_i1.p2 TRINITY_DN6222_c1_g4~~TRINITY_DN6222_c1_g4_i1.p2  ORF type:complete len:301 (+),score=73.94 TRINITY_DN6222_c1_g4_i1:209-1111(+)
MTSQSNAVQQVEDFDVGSIVVSTAKSVVKNRPVSVSLWVVGLLLAAFATGFKVDEATAMSHSINLQHAQEVGAKELATAMRNYQQADQKYRQLKGWFWSCDARCQQAYDRVKMATAEIERIQSKRDAIITEARQEVGIWSTYGVQDVRDSFWAAWKSGKDFAARYTMMDAMFMMIGGREETMASMVIKIVFQYVVNLTMGIIGAFFFFVYNVYTLIVSYGEPALSGLAFFLLVLVAGLSTIGTYLFAIYGTVAGGGVYLVKQAAKQAKLEAERGHRPRQVQYGQYGGGRVGGQQYRSHYD